MKERCIDIRCIFFFAVILHRIDDNKDNFRTTIETTCDRINSLGRSREYYINNYNQFYPRELLIIN